MQKEKGSSAAHTKLLKQTLIELGKRFETGRFFRNEVGQGWFFPPWTKFFEKENARYLVYGMSVGTPDIVGFTIKEITEDMVGQKIAIFTGYEIKTGESVQSVEQKNFQKILESFNGIYKVIRSVGDL